MRGAKIYVAGAVEDASFPDDMKRRLDDALTAAGVDHRVETYAGLRHGWVPSDTPVHDPEGAERHFRALFELLAAANLG
jgi:carboxymethylenebutenolidase